MDQGYPSPFTTLSHHYRCKICSGQGGHKIKRITSWITACSQHGEMTTPRTGHKMDNRYGVVFPCVNSQHNTRQYRTSQTGQVMDYKWNTELITFPQHKTVTIQLKERTTPKTWITETLVQSLLTLNITQDSPITAQTQHYTRQPNHSLHSILHKTDQSLPTLNITQDSAITIHTRHYTKQWSNGTQNELQKHQASCCPLSVWQKMVARQDDK